MQFLSTISPTRLAQRVQSGHYVRVGLDRDRRAQLIARSIFAVAVAAAVSASCGGSSSSLSGATTSSSRQAGPNEEGIRAAAMAYANAFLTGSYADVERVLDPSCIPTGVTASDDQIASASAELERLRQGLTARAGIDPAAITIRGVAVRYLTGDAGQAEVRYSVPIEVAGNDNWISYSFDRGHWHVAGCQIRWPIGGRSASDSITSGDPERAAEVPSAR